MKRFSPFAGRGTASKAASLPSYAKFLSLAVLIGLAIAASNLPVAQAKVATAPQFDSTQWMVLVHRLDTNPMGVAIPSAVSSFN